MKNTGNFTRYNTSSVLFMFRHTVNHNFHQFEFFKSQSSSKKQIPPPPTTVGLNLCHPYLGKTTICLFHSRVIYMQFTIFNDFKM